MMVPESSAPAFATLSLFCTIGACETLSNPVKFTSKAELKQHQKVTHKVWSKRCLLRKCKRSFASKPKLIQHIQSCHNDVGSQWRCADCDKELRSYRALRKHAYYYHERGRFGCSLRGCSFVGLNRLAVLKHQRSIHHPQVNGSEGENSAKMEEEAMEFGNENDNKFLKQVVNASRYYCKWDKCIYNCRQRSNMVKHVRTVHFHLPRSLKLQKEANIEDDRNAKDYFVKI